MSPGGAYGGDPHDDAHDNDDYNAHGGDHDDAHDLDDEDDNAHGGDHDDDSSDYFTTADLLGCTRVSRRELSDHINDVDDETNGDVDTENASYGDDDDGLCIIVRVIRAYVFFAGARLLVRPLKPHHQGSWSHEGGLVSGPKITIFACSQPCLLDSHL